MTDQPWNHNPLADLSGPHFLLLYACVIVGTLFWVALSRQGLDPASEERPPLVPAHPDPYEIAYLRGGENEVTRVTVFSLIQRDTCRSSNSPEAAGVRPENSALVAPQLGLSSPPRLT